MGYTTKGKVISELKRASGVTHAGKDWERIDYLLEVEDRYKTKLRFSMYSFDGPVENEPIQGEVIELYFVIECREYQGNWFNEVKATFIKRINEEEG